MMRMEDNIMKQRSIKTLLSDMETLKKNFLNTKVYFPYMEKNMLGKKSKTTPPFYINKGFNIKFIFNQPITEKHIRNNNEVSGWINQNFIVRLYALLDFYKVTNKIDQSLDGWKEVDLLRRLRNIFAHTSVKFNSRNKEHNRLGNELVSYFNIHEMIPNKFPIPIDKVCIPIYDGCVRYIHQKYNFN